MEAQLPTKPLKQKSLWAVVFATDDFTKGSNIQKGSPTQQGHSQD